MRWIWASARMILAHDLVQNNQSSPSPAAQSRINPAILFVIVILAAIFFVSGLLHLLVRFLSKSSPSSSREETLESEALQRQLQQLFHLHDSGLDQAFIDALPVFLYEDMIGEEDPFDCAVCLSEFSAGDKLRLLPVCSHAFHIACIDAWLLCNSTCPLCRATLFAPGQAIENPAFDLLDEDEDSEKRVFSVRLGKFRNVSEEREVEREEGETSSSCLGARRCYSMGSYQYVVGDPQLRVALTRRRKKTQREETSPENGKRIWAGSKDESFSVSKIWQWSNQKGKLPVAAGDCREWNPAEGGRRVAVDL